MTYVSAADVTLHAEAAGCLSARAGRTFGVNGPYRRGRWPGTTARAGWISAGIRRI
ncbi:MAG: hypothetical protein J2P17_20505 [Mycobacterium sp.]|nr:hypothetical protein [Mycobacterium sp.]